MICNLAVLITCHNRKDITLYCLNALFNVKREKLFRFDVFLVDDGSTDGTEEAVKRCFPSVKIIHGDGNLYWNQGMRLAWQTAVKVNNYDFYLLLNDDTIIDENALVHLLDVYNDAFNMNCNSSVIVGACRSEHEKNRFSYGGRNSIHPVLPNGNMQECQFINGNIVLVPDVIFKTIGMLSNSYTHGLGDYDYGLRARESGYKCYTSRDYIATCPPNTEVPGWCNPKNSLKVRWEMLHSPRGLNITEYNHYRKKFWGVKWIYFATKAYLKAISPTLYSLLSKSE